MKDGVKNNNNLFLLSRLKHFVDTSKRKLFYHAHISSHLTYASTVWDGYSDILFKKKLNSLHRRAAKLMLPDPSTTTEAKMQCLGSSTPAQTETYVQQGCISN